MKKVISFVAIAAITMFVASCGDGGAAETARKADSAHMADSMATVAMAAKADSAHIADSTKAAADAAEAARVADSAHKADSAAAGKKGGATKPKDKAKADAIKVTSGRG